PVETSGEASAEPADEPDGEGEGESDGERRHRRRRRRRRGGEREARNGADERGDDEHGSEERAGDERGQERRPVDVAGQAAADAQPVPEPQQPSHVEHAASPASRRRSTVREPAPFVIGAAEAPVFPTPRVETPTMETPVEADHQKAEEAGQPRRTGWWARRLL